MKTIRIKLGKEVVKRKISGKQALKILGKLYEDMNTAYGLSQINKPDKNIGYAAINMFIGLFGEETTEKLLLLCGNLKTREKLMKKLKRIIKRDLYPLVLRARKQEDRQGVKKYL